MQDVVEKNIIYLCDENTPYANEFTLLSDSEIADLIERRLFSNNYFSYTIYSIHKSKGTIVLIRDECGHKIETTLSKIEDGLIPEKCIECRHAEKDKLIAFRDKLQDELKERGLVVVLFETEEGTDSIYVECTKCGAKYYLNDDFSLSDEAGAMYCKNWDCMMETLVLEMHWFAKGIEKGSIIIKENTYNSYFYPFVQDHEDWFESLTSSDGYYESKCEECNTIIILPFGKWECTACLFSSLENYTVEKWDEINNQVTIVCKKCGNKYPIQCEKSSSGEMLLDDEILGCFECYKKNLDYPYICPVCDTKHYDKRYSCHTCGFVLGEFLNGSIKTQTQFTEWLKNTVNPCARIWNEINPKYAMAIHDLNVSLENEIKLLKENRELNEKLSQCFTEIAENNKKFVLLNEEIRYKNAKISEMEEKTALLSMFSQQQTSVAKPNFRNLINKFAIVLNDDITIEYLKKEAPEDIKVNSILVYGYYDEMAGISFLVLGLTFYEDGDYTLVWINNESVLTVRCECYEKSEIIPVNNKTFFKCFDKMVSIHDPSSFWSENDIAQTRKFEILDEFRHFSFPDDVLITFINHDIKKIEKIWARLKKYVGRDKGCDVFVATLLNEPFDERFEVHENEDVFAVVRKDDDGSYVLLGLKIGL